ncbi:MAG TPA: glycosyl hydrolase family 28 protein, partial [Verrucomicrobiae bacterium]|nr:glycosyl hydrolase family 28 protein [Verrucomicrobiae bacterium]
TPGVIVTKPPAAPFAMTATNATTTNSAARPRFNFNAPVTPERAAAGFSNQLGRGYAIVTYRYTQCGADNADFRNSSFYPAYPDYDWGVLLGWAWGCPAWWIISKRNRSRTRTSSSRWASGGSVVVVPAGNYLIGSIELKSHTTLRLEKDARLLGSPDLDDYPVIKVRWEGKWIDGHRALISAHDAEGIAVVGPGKISGNPALSGRQMPRRPVIIEPIKCTNVQFEGFATEHRSIWSIHPTYCENVVAKNLTIRSTSGNGDGIDVDSCQHVRIEGCDIATGDDCIAIKSGRGVEGYRIAKPTEDVLISGCTLADSIFADIGIGSETSGGIRDVRIEHCNFVQARSCAIYIKSNTGRGAFIEDISARDLEVSTAPGGFLRVNLISSGIRDPEPVLGIEGIPSAKNFSFSNVKVDCGTLVDAAAISPVKPINGFSLADISGTCKKAITLANLTNAILRDIRVTGYTGPFLTQTNVQGTGLEASK